MVRTIVDDRLLCRLPECSDCAIAPEFVSVHYDCYTIYLHESKLEPNEALSRLWVVGLWRSPWPRAPLIHLSRNNLPINQEALIRVAEIYGIPWLSRFPPEIIHIIRQLSLHELLWRSISVIHLAAQLSIPSEPLSKIPLDSILSWERGAELIRTSSSSHPPWVRLTISPDGISKVERLAKRPQYNGTQTECLAFIVEQDLADVDAEFKDGLLRLCLPRPQRTLQIWNTPAPPDPTTCLFRPMRHVTWQRLHAIELDRICGITFFFVGGELYGIYVHHSPDSCAVEVYKRFPNRRRLRAVWCYLPIARKDRVVVLGTRTTEFGLNVLVRTRLSGDVIIGCLGQRSDLDRLLGKDQITFIYGEPDELQPVLVFGASCPTPVEKSGFPRPFSLQDFQPTPPRAYFSWAPLKDVLSTHTFYDKDTGLCRGIILYYENGGSRAVGQCRLHVDDSILVARPSRLCFQATTYLTRIRKQERHGVRVEFGAGGDDPHGHGGGEGWECRPLRGVLELTFTEDASYLAVAEDAQKYD
ncbi:hypothetical protein ACRALDRAFT_2030768 [Sodiomyces alcalophilus JCM 7366]|uniref:uncharacterized protein n=1 Tax=Sodiomyces alcalophilus JCM 7366 TaxID=591952 RepID=UPI0039B66639